MPEVGVPNKIKREYLQADRREELFAWHEKNILAKNPEYIEQINELAKTQNIVLICYERDPLQCHRSHGLCPAMFAIYIALAMRNSPYLGSFL